MQRPNEHDIRTDIRTKTQQNVLATQTKSNNEVVRTAKQNLGIIQQQYLDQMKKIAELDEDVTASTQLLTTALEEKTNLTRENIALSAAIHQNGVESTPFSANQHISTSAYNMTPYHTMRMIR